MSSAITALRKEIRPMAGLAIPVVLAELGWVAMGVADTIMVGSYGTEAIGAVGIGRVLFFTVTVFGMGLLLGLDTVVSTSYGAGNLLDCRRSLAQGVFLSLALTPFLMLVIMILGSQLERWGIDADVRRATLPYMRAIAWSTLPLLLYTAFRRYLQGVNRVRPVMIALISANVINAAANWVLIYGNLGAPALGAAGAGWATCLSCIYMALFLVAAVRLHIREDASPSGRLPFRPSMPHLRRLIGLGFPAASQLVVEVGVFGAATALAGRLDTASIAAHQIALTAASVTYMVPLGISAAGAVRVGQALGRNDPSGARRAGWTALLFGAGFMGCAGCVFLLAPRSLLRLFTTDPGVTTVGVSLLAVAALFQLFDGLQVVATGNLRGAGNTRTPLAWNLVGHWLLGLPVGYGLCFGLGWGVVGLWVGWLVGLGLVGLVLVLVWRRTARAFPTRGVQ